MPCTNCAARTFNRVTVDGDTSTNDNVRGAGQRYGGKHPHRVEGRDYTIFVAALTEVCSIMARAIAGRRRGRHPADHLPSPDARSEESAERLSKAVVGPPGEGGHVRRRRQLGPGPVRHGLFQGPLPPGRGRDVPPAVGGDPGLQSGRGVDFDEAKAKAVLSLRMKWSS